jgi:uncharacterized membrane protein
MSEVPVQIIVAAFSSPDGAGKVMEDLKQEKKQGLIGIQDAAVIVKDSTGKLKITDSRHHTRRGMITGGVIGGMIGLLAGPVGWAAVGGGVIGGLAGKAAGSPMKKRLEDIGQALTPNSSAIIAVIDDKWVAQVQAAMVAEGAKVVQESIKADIAEQLKAGGNVVYTAVATSGGVAAGRMTEPKDQPKQMTEGTGQAAMESGVPVENATLTQEPMPKEASAAAKTSDEGKPSTN